MLPKKKLKVSAIFASSAKTLPSSTSIIYLFLDPFFAMKSGDTIFQNNLYTIVALLSIFNPIFFSFEFENFITNLRPIHDCFIKFFVYSVFLVSSDVSFLEWCMRTKQINKF